MREGTVPDGVAQGDALDLIATIYDAAIAPDNWPTVLDACRLFVGGSSAAIFSKNVTGQRRQLLYDDGRLDPALTKEYFDHWATIDPNNSIHVFSPVEQGVIISQHVAPQDFAETRFAREWAFPLGMVDFGSATLERHGDWSTIFGVFRNERDGLGDEQMRQRIGLLAPHIRRAIRIGNAVGAANQRADTFRDTIDALAVAVILVDAEGRLVHANHAADDLLGRSSLSSGQRGFLRLDRSGMRDLLPKAGELAPHSVTLETTSGARFVVYALPLAGHASGNVGQAVAALFIQPASFDPLSVPESLAHTFELTPAELRVSLATIRFDKVADVATYLGLSEATIKTHLSHIFSKTDTRRQADIVKLIAAFASPLAPQRLQPPF
ncbi:MAG: LuxR family transcriptional regulator [Candidatus Devosia phytovorans]|uniref:LuxR family transcriptional regulator n=1 Tax=Candidatus Devosia phytovorans TaxID=3121372 RepID=A0AAJ6B140_9HYPH|nr:LuxR family transcriptional regulator [Devosia sp.]WEK05376.1 MAG: LuxR family transcriptional regulator [Devosia sp.]